MPALVASLTVLGAVNTFLTYFVTSSWVMRFFLPVPVILSSGAPSSRAKRLTEGEAWLWLSADFELV